MVYNCMSNNIREGTSVMLQNIHVPASTYFVARMIFPLENSSLEADALVLKVTIN